MRQTAYDDLYEFLPQLRDDKFEGYPGITYENGRKHLQDRLDSDAFYAIEHAASGKVIGNIYCGNRDYCAREVGYIINKNYQSQGYAAEALSAVIDNIFREGTHTGSMLNVIRGTPLHGNSREGRYAPESPFQAAHLFPQRCLFCPHLWKDTYVYALLKSDIRPITDRINTEGGY